MKMLSSLFPIFFLVVSFYIPGCTNVDTPVRNQSDESSPAEYEAFTIVPEKGEVLDTEPVVITAKGGKAPITWKTQPEFMGQFQPPTGDSVVFAPADVKDKHTIEIVAYDKSSQEASCKIVVIDEGIPPQHGDILINELCWAGSRLSAYDEWIELVNRTDKVFYLNNWWIENAAGLGKNLVFYGLIEPGGTLLISNYTSDSNKTALTVVPDYVNPMLALSNSVCGPFVLHNAEGIVFDTVGDGGKYPFGLNEKDCKASMARYTTSTTTQWDKDSWYTEGVAINLNSGSWGSPGQVNSDISFHETLGEDDARGIITEYCIDAKDEIGEDWAEVYITKSGTIRNFIITDLDGEDHSITNDVDVNLEEGVYILVVWGDEYSRDGNTYTIPDTNPTGTKDELVLLSSGVYLDGLCYYSTDNVQFDDRDSIEAYGWSGNPIHSKHAVRVLDDSGMYKMDCNSTDWDVTAGDTPGLKNW